MKSLVLNCGTYRQMRNVHSACRRFLNGGGNIQCESILVAMIIDCGTIDDLKSIARERARVALTNTPRLQNSGGALIAMGISGDDYHLAMVLLVVTDRGGAEEEMIEVAHSATNDNFEEYCFTLLQKISVFV